MDSDDKREQRILHTKTLKAGKRTYFFDVKDTIGGEYYLSLTESKKFFNKDDGNFYFKRHSIFLYKENMKEFIEILQQSIDFIEKNQGEIQKFHQHESESE